MLDLKALISKLVNTPLVIEQGTSGNWTYRKWSDGTAECWADVNSGSAPSNTSVNGWYGATMATPDFPTNLFNAIPNVFVNVYSWGTGYHFGFAYSITQTAARIRAIRNDNNKSIMYAHVYAIGTWK